MKYQITIIKFEDNVNYEAEMAAFRERKNDRYYNSMNESREPMPVIPIRSLEMILTEDEFKKIKAESFKTFE